jgi:hypothetical protein
MKPTSKDSRKLKALSEKQVFRVLRQSNTLRNPRRLRRAITSTGCRQSPEWTLQEQAILGKMPDAEAAKRLGRTFNAVRLRRSRLGIPNFGNPVRFWTPEELALLGTMPDRLLARKIRRTTIAITCRRSQLNIPAMIEGYHRWRPEDEALLGQRPDKYIAKLLGISVMAVRHRRHALKIYERPPTPRVFQKWTPEEDALIGTASSKSLPSFRTGRQRMMHCSHNSATVKWPNN